MSLRINPKHHAKLADFWAALQRALDAHPGVKAVSRSTRGSHWFELLASFRVCLLNEPLMTADAKVHASLQLRFNDSSEQLSVRVTSDKYLPGVRCRTFESRKHDRLTQIDSIITAMEKIAYKVAEAQSAQNALDVLEEKREKLLVSVRKRLPKPARELIDTCYGNHTSVELGDREYLTLQSEADADRLVILTHALYLARTYPDAVVNALRKHGEKPPSTHHQD